MAEEMSPHVQLPLHTRITVVKLMLYAFTPVNAAQIQVALGKTVDTSVITPITLHDFLNYAKHASWIKEPWTMAFQIAKIAQTLTESGLLQRMPGQVPPPWGDYYYAIQKGPTKAQSSGDLWLADSLGPEFLIRSFMSSTVPVIGKDKDGAETTGSGLLIDDRHILTNRHVVTDMTVNNRLWTSPTPPADSQEPTGDPVELQVTDILCHHSVDGSDKHLDVALIRVTGLEGKYDAGKGIAFRDPQWSDTSWTFGYPPVPMTRESALVVHRGEVVNPHVIGYSGNALMLFSATSRPGNSGGPIVAEDGRVVGIVAEELSMQEGAQAPFYAGVPTHEIHRALSEMGHPNLLNIETWQSPSR